uniref:Uncharacterized protein n=1 Tax=Picocystis salinarum TaxID=88271 RepID=A0A7S3UEB9_9CHLO|mmetsp:Transcript_10205/g.62252  ORF Transcript_10205/g.62252 Transcript_10205/m.62252 type:complete len:603 (+) Transcript_10205:323-2131(+)
MKRGRRTGSWNVRSKATRCSTQEATRSPRHAWHETVALARRQNWTARRRGPDGVGRTSSHALHDARACSSRSTSAAPRLSPRVSFRLRRKRRARSCVGTSSSAHLSRVATSPSTARPSASHSFQVVVVARVHDVDVAQRVAGLPVRCKRVRFEGEPAAMASESGRKRRRWDASVADASTMDDKAAKAEALKAKIEARLQRIQAKDPKEIVLEKDVAKETSATKEKEAHVVERGEVPKLEDASLERYAERGWERKPRSELAFVEAGKFQRQAHNERLKAKYGEEVAKKMRRREMRDDKFGPKPGKEKEDPSTPDVEWWDAPLLMNGTYEDVDEDKCNLVEEKISVYVEHPVPIEPPAEAPPPPPQPLKLTKKEMKKLRTQRRQAREKEKQALIAQGLLEPPKPKVKISNLMRVLGEEASMDPTAIEKEVRKQMEERQRAHEDRNLARQLTPAEKREKKLKKMFDSDVPNETHVAVFRIRRLDNPQHRFKVDVNARENRLTGVCLITSDMVLVVAEGVPKAIKRYSKLLLNRIDWNADVETSATTSTFDKRHNTCECVWQGIVAKPNFRKFRVEDCELEALARRTLAGAGVEHYWDMASNVPET